MNKVRSDLDERKRRKERSPKMKRMIDEMDVIFCCFSERDKQVYERIVFPTGY